VTHFVNLRAGPWGAVCSPYVLSGDALATPMSLTSVNWEGVPFLVRGRNVLLVAHGFNVDFNSGVRSLQRLEAALGIDPVREAFFGVLWPGDWTIPAINYPAEDRIASHAGALLGDFCNRWLASAASISFASHSLGARVILEAIQASKRRIRMACITAGALNSAALCEEYEAAAANCDAIRTLSSMQDLVLKLAFPAGDIFADLLDPDHPPLEAAMGRAGPTGSYPSYVAPSEIPDSPPYDHEDYLPPGSANDPGPAAAGGPDWRNPAAFVAKAFRSRAPGWPAT
jgi:hypothetical protein